MKLCLISPCSHRSNRRATVNSIQCLQLSLALLLLLCVSVGRISAQTAVPVTTWRYDLTHAGQNTNETVLTPDNVSPSTFGKLFSLSIDGLTYAQPLYVPNLKMKDGQVHNVLFVATSHDSVYAFDADSNGGSNSSPIWHINLLTTAYGAQSGESTVPWGDNHSPDVGENGVTGTPAIDLSTNTMYFVATSKLNGVYYARLHAIDLISGAEKFGGPANITATVSGTGTGSSGGKLTFSPLIQNQRTPVNFYNGYVYFGYAAHGDIGNWHGWLFAYNATTLKQSAVLCLSPNGYGAGIWGSGAGMPIDNGVSGGRMFFTTGNGTHGTAQTPTVELGESIVEVNLANGALTPKDIFVTYNADLLNSHDLDLGSAGLLMVPDQQGNFPHEIVQAGKEGRIVVLNRDHLGGFAGTSAGSNTNALQDITGETTGLWNTPAYWNGNVYIWGNKSYPELFHMNNGVMDKEPSSKSSITAQFPSPSFSISSNGTQDGIAWAVRSDQFNNGGAAVLYAWDANDLTSPLYESDTNSKRDAAGPANKFAIPIVTNGKVYVATKGQINVYGLFNGDPVAAAPTISPNGGSFSPSTDVTLDSKTSTATIYYTLDGSTPTTASLEYTDPFTLSTNTTVKAMASAPNYIQSSVTSATFTFSNQTPSVTFSPGGGNYTSTQQVTLSDTDANASIFYTTDGSTPSANSNQYTSGTTIAVSKSMTINAIAIDSSLQNSNVSSAVYVISAAGPTIDFSQGFAETTGLTLNGSAIATDDTRLQLTNGGKAEGGSVFWNTPVNIGSFTSSFEFQLSSAQGDGFTFTLQNVKATALGGAYGGLGYQGIKKSVAVKFDLYSNAGEGTDSTGVYVNGAAPTVPAVNMSTSGVVLKSGDAMQATITYDGTTLKLTLTDLVLNKTFTYSKAINIASTIGSSKAYVGFTGSTGGLTSSQKLVSWTYATP